MTFETLLAELVDRQAVGRWPRPPFRAAQLSSRGPGEDRGHFLAIEDTDGGDRYVLVDEEGPGALVRLWSANPEGAGTIRIWIDDRLVIEAPMAELLAGTTEGVGPPLAARRGGGSVLLLPLPYQRSCRVTVDRASGGGLYYTAAVRRYAPRTVIEAIEPSTLAAARDRLDQVSALLDDPVPEDLGGGGWTARGEVAPGYALTLELPPGPAVVRRLAVRSPVDDLHLVLFIDGHLAADLPVELAFGTGPGQSPYQTWWASATTDGWLELRLPLPYRSRARIDLRSMGRGSGSAQIEADVDPTDAMPDLEIRGSWRTQTLPTRPRTVWRGADLVGPGILVADTLVVDNPAEGWWGAGDVILTVDGGAAPTLAGTGTEDYYGAAWCSHEAFASALAAQPRSDAGGPDPCTNARGVSVWTRGRSLDRVPFPRRLAFDLEVRHREDTSIRYTLGVWWYRYVGR